MTRARRPATLVLLALGLALPACAEDNKVGSGVDTDLGGETGGGPRLGERTTTTAAPVTQPPTTAAAAPTTAKVATPTQPPATQPPTTARPAQVFEVAITQAGFEPSNVRVFTGQQVRYTNNDSEVRSVKASDGRFTSGDLAPGASWVFSTSQAGRYDITDGTRPFVVGSIEVLPR